MLLHYNLACNSEVSSPSCLLDGHAMSTNNKCCVAALLFCGGSSHVRRVKVLLHLAATALNVPQKRAYEALPD